VVLAAALFGAWLALRIGGARATLWIDDAGTALVAILACAACVLAARASERRTAPVLDAARMRYGVLGYRRRASGSTTN